MRNCPSGQKVKKKIGEKTKNHKLIHHVKHTSQHFVFLPLPFCTGLTTRPLRQAEAETVLEHGASKLSQ